MSATLPIELDRTAAEPLYRQVAIGVRRAIDGGRLRPGERLPSVRALAGQLEVGRLTVATAYEHLAADGYLVSRMGFGTIVAPHPPEAIRPSNRGGVGDAGDGGNARDAANPAKSRGPVRLPAIRTAFANLPAAGGGGGNPGGGGGHPGGGSHPGGGGGNPGGGGGHPGAGGATPGRRGLGPVPRFDLRAGGSGGTGTAGGPGLTVGPALERLLRTEWRILAESGGGAASADPAGDPLLRAAIAAHMRASRAARCEPAQVVILSGPIIAIGAVARLWLGPQRRALVEDPGDPTFRRALAVTGAAIAAVPIDTNGIRVEQLLDDVAVALVSPSVQMPTGVATPLARRRRLLAWAAGSGAIVVEDGRADELTIGGSPPACLQGMDEDGRVIHLGSFESLLHSGVRVGFAIVPAAFVDSFVGALDAIDPGPSPVQQRALGRFLADGHLDRHLARVRRALRDRQAATLEALARELGWLVDVQPASGGTRLVATIQDPAWTATEVVTVAAEAGVALDSLAACRIGPSSDRELVFDFGHHEPAELQAAIRILARALATPGAGIGRRPNLDSLPTGRSAVPSEFRVS